MTDLPGLNGKVMDEQTLLLLHLMSIDFLSLATPGAGDSATGSGVDHDLPHAQAVFACWFHRSPWNVSAIILRNGRIAAFLAFWRILALREVKHLAVADDGKFKPFLALLAGRRFGHKVRVAVAVNAVSVLLCLKVQVNLAVLMLPRPGLVKVDDKTFSPAFGGNEAGALKAQQVDG